MSKKISIVPVPKNPPAAKIPDFPPAIEEEPVKPLKPVTDMSGKPVTKAKPRIAIVAPVRKVNPGYVTRGNFGLFEETLQRILA